MANKKEKKEKVKLLDSYIYACDIKGHPDAMQLFMYSSKTKDQKKRPYSVMTEINGGKYTVYNSPTGPALSMLNVRQATRKESDDFFRAAMENDLEFDQVQAKWFNSSEPNVTPAKYHDVFLDEVCASGEIKKRDYDNSLDIRRFLVVDEKINEIAEIIGEVSSIKGNVYTLSAWAYSDQPEIIRKSSQIIPTKSEPLYGKNLYKFMNTRFNSLVENSSNYSLIDDCVKKHMTFQSHLQKDAKEYLGFWLKRLVEDSHSGKIVIVKFREHNYQVFPPINEYDESKGKTEAYCNITLTIKGIGENNIDTYFGRGSVIDIKVYEQMCQEHAERQYKINASKQIEVADDGFVEDDDCEDMPSINSLKNLKSCDGGIFEPGCYATPKEAAENVQEGSDEKFIIINADTQWKPQMVLTDDVCATLHSRKLNAKGVTYVFGPLRDADETFKYLSNQLLAYGWDKEDNFYEPTKIKNPDDQRPIDLFMLNIFTIQKMLFQTTKGVTTLFGIPLKHVHDYC